MIKLTHWQMLALEESLKAAIKSGLVNEQIGGSQLLALIQTADEISVKTLK